MHDDACSSRVALKGGHPFMPDLALWPLRMRHRPCRVVVLTAGTLNGDGPGGAAGLQCTLDDLALDLQPGERLDVVDTGTDLGTALARLAPDVACDVAWVVAGTRVRSGWRQLLLQGLEADAALATVSALHLDLPWFSPVGSGGSTQGMEAELAAWLERHAGSNPIELGAPMPACGVLRAEAMVSLRMDEPPHAQEAMHRSGASMARAWWQRLADRGWLHGVSQRVLVHGSLLPTTLDDATLPLGGLRADAALWAAAHPLTGLRHAVDVALRGPGLKVRLAAGTNGASQSDSLAPVGKTPQVPPVRLHVAHSWGGGLSKWVRDFIHIDEKNGSGRGLVLRSVGVFGAFGQRLVLYAGADDTAPLRYWELGVPIHATSLAHLEVRQILREIVRDFGVDQVLVSSLIGHSLDVLQTGLPTVLVAHDHHPFCITLYAQFEGECRDCSGHRLRRCMQYNGGHRFYRGIQPQEWEALRASFVSIAKRIGLRIVAPTVSVATRWQALMPDLDPAQFSVIGHGLELPPTPAYTPPERGPLRVVVLGRLSAEKGEALLAEMREPLLEFAQVLLVGCGERIHSAWRHPGVTVIPSYTHEELPALLAKLAPHVGLLMSTVPETFSYALSELWHAGIPVVSTDGGAFSDRVAHGVTGFLEPAEPQALLRRLQMLHKQRDVLERLRKGVESIEPRGLDAMLTEYERLLPTPPLGRLPVTTPPDDGPDAARSTSYMGSTGSPHRGRRAIHVNPEVTWRQALQGFWYYTCLKASHSPRLHPAIRRWFSGRA